MYLKRLMMYFGVLDDINFNFYFDNYYSEKRTYNYFLSHNKIKTFEMIKNESIVNFVVFNEKYEFMYFSITHSSNCDYEYAFTVDVGASFRFGHIDVIKYLNKKKCLDVPLNKVIYGAVC